MEKWETTRDATPELRLQFAETKRAGISPTLFYY